MDRGFTQARGDDEMDEQTDLTRAPSKMVTIKMRYSTSEWGTKGAKLLAAWDGAVYTKNGENAAAGWSSLLMDKLAVGPLAPGPVWLFDESRRNRAATREQKKKCDGCSKAVDACTCSVRARIKALSDSGYCSVCRLAGIAYPARIVAGKLNILRRLGHRMSKRKLQAFDAMIEQHLDELEEEISGAKAITVQWHEPIALLKGHYSTVESGSCGGIATECIECATLPESGFPSKPTLSRTSENENGTGKTIKIHSIDCCKTLRGFDGATCRACAEESKKAQKISETIDSGKTVRGPMVTKQLKQVLRLAVRNYQCATPTADTPAPSSADTPAHQSQPPPL